MSQLRQRFSAAAPAPAGGGGVLASLKKYDAYAKPLDDFRIRTVTGAAVTILSTLFILFLTFSEFVDWYQKEMVPSLEVDKGRKERMNINLNITFPHMPCYMLSIDVMDVAGEHQNNLPHSMHKTRIDQFGNIIEKNRGELGGKDAGIDKTAVDKTADPKYCGSCYGGVAPASGCCNSCEDVRSAYERAGWSFSDPDSIEQCVREGWSKKIKEQSKESCNVHGHVEVNKVQGNLHFAPGRSFQQNNMHVHDLHDFGVEGGQFNFEHTIHSLSFGDQVDFVNPLDNVHKKPPAKFFTYQYFIKVVGTDVEYLNSTRIFTNQFSVTEHEQDVTPAFGACDLPCVFFNFEISPMLVKYKEFRKPFTHFLTDLCAIVGGVFTVAGMIDGFLYATQRSLKAKTELGKNT
nr:Endoplasmic reticulum-Golgi intermediate compartment protein 3 [Polyrhizophydium stewartii]